MRTHKPNQTKEGAPSYINLLNDTLDIISRKGLFIIITVVIVVVVVIYCFVFNEQNMFASIMLMYSYNIRAAYVSFDICCRFCCSRSVSGPDTNNKEKLHFYNSLLGPFMHVCIKSRFMPYTHTDAIRLHPYIDMYI